MIGEQSIPQCAAGKILGHYRIVEKIGAGGMGEVYRAHDEHLARDVAIKVLPPGTLIDESARKHFHKEALILSQLTHPNITTIHDFDTQQGVDFLVMEYIPGITLSEKVAGRPLAEKEVLRLGVQLAEGLSAAHEHGAVHRDLKPGNLQVTSDGRLKILDFGLAKLRLPVTDSAATGSLSETQGMAGTVPYMAPEQLLGAEIDARTDIHAVGAVLYEMATGQRPFGEVERSQLIGAILHTPPLSPTVLNPSLSPELGRIIGKCLEKEPENRYQYAKELAVDLRCVGRDKESGHSAAEAPPLTPQRSSFSRHWKPIAATAGVVTVLLLGAAFWLFRFARGAPGGLVLTSTRQLTYLGAVGGRILTDGRRIYFANGAKNPLHYVSVNGGEATVIPSPLSRWVGTLHISHDGAYLLINALYGPKGGIESPIWLVDVNSGAARKLGDIEGQDAAFAPDGKTIVVAKDRSLYLTDTQGANPVKLAEAPGKVSWPRWSPDGQRLRFTVWDGTKLSDTLWELSSGGALHQLFAGWKKASSLCCGEWTADGKYYLFNGDRQYWWVSERSVFGHSEPALLTTIGNGVYSAVPSPLGNTIYAGVALGAGWDIFKWDLKPNHTPSLLYPEMKVGVLGFSRDGQWVAYGHKAPTGYELWRARADGTDKVQLTTAFDWIYIVRFSPDGRKIAIMAVQPHGLYKIYWVSADGSALHEIPGPNLVQADPTWSPDSQSIMFGLPPELFGGGGSEVVRHLYLYDLRSDKTTEVHGSTGLFSPRWSPDGRYIAAMTADLQGMSLLDTTTSEWRSLTRHSTDNPFWSLDSTWVYFNDIGSTGLWRIHVGDGRLEELGPIPLPPGYTFCRAEAFAPDETAVLRCADSRTDIFALDYK